MPVDDKKKSFSDKGAGIPLVFVHGFPLSRQCWQPQVDSLSSSFRTIAPDLLGFGGRQGESGTISMQRFAEDVAILIDDLGCGPVVLVGHSMGGYVALALAQSRPELLRGLVLVGTRAGGDSPEAAAGRRATAERVREIGIDGVVEAMTQKMLAPSNRNQQSLETVRGFMASASPEAVIGALLGMAERPDATSTLATISVPVLVVTGTEDEVIDPAESEALANAIPDARLQIIQSAGHLVAWERAQEFNTVLEDWLGNVG